MSILLASILLAGMLLVGMLFAGMLLACNRVMQLYFVPTAVSIVHTCLLAGACHNVFLL